MVRLQVTMESGGLRGSRHAQHPIREHMAARYRPLQQVSIFMFPAVYLLYIAECFEREAESKRYESLYIDR